jgi:3-oxoacyl-[acyl-carrier protein] reductase
LVNNAGIVTKGLLAMTSIKQLKDVFQVNFFGHVQLTQVISKIMMRQKAGCIINMCSIGGIDAFPAYVSYGCSKAAMTYFTKTLSKELAPYGIRVNGVAPGMAATDMQKQLKGEANDEILHRTAMSRVADPMEIADLVYYLSSPQSSYITGQIIRIDGGM